MSLALDGCVRVPFELTKHVPISLNGLWASRPARDNEVNLLDGYNVLCYCGGGGGGGQRKHKNGNDEENEQRDKKRQSLTNFSIWEIRRDT